MRDQGCDTVHRGPEPILGESQQNKATREQKKKVPLLGEAAGRQMALVERSPFRDPIVLRSFPLSRKLHLRNNGREAKEKASPIASHRFKRRPVGGAEIRRKEKLCAPPPPHLSPAPLAEPIPFREALNPDSPLKP